MEIKQLTKPYSCLSRLRKSCDFYTIYNISQNTGFP